MWHQIQLYSVVSQYSLWHWKNRCLQSHVAAVSVSFSILQVCYLEIAGLEFAGDASLLQKDFVMLQKCLAERPQQKC